MHHRLEFKDAKSEKFWEISVEGASYTVTYGKIGTSGQTKTKEFGGENEALAAAKKAMASKVKKGYADVAGSEASAAPEEQGATEKAPPKKAPKKTTKKKATKAAPVLERNWFLERQRPDLEVDDPRKNAVSPDIAVHGNKISLAWFTGDATMSNDPGVIGLRHFDGTDWRDEDLEGKFFAHITYGPQGDLHLVHGRQDNSIVYRHCSDGKWTSHDLPDIQVKWATADGHSYSGYNCIAVDSNGVVHMVVSDESVRPAVPVYFRKTGDAIEKEPIAGGAGCRALLVDKDDNLHMFLKNDDFMLEHRTRSPSGDWSSETVGEKYATSGSMRPSATTAPCTSSFRVARRPRTASPIYKRPVASGPRR